MVPKLSKIEDRSEEQTLKQERCARRVAWKMTKRIHKLRGKGQSTFNSTSEVWCLIAPSSTNPEDTKNSNLKDWKYHANPWADQAQREKITLCGELEMRNRLFQASHQENEKYEEFVATKQIGQDKLELMN